MPASYGVFIDWENTGGFGGAGENVTRRTLKRTDLQIQYGRDQARMLSPLAPGEAGFELDNRSRDYSPENSGSPLAGNVLPGRQAKIEATLNGATFGLFRGFLDDFDVLPEINSRSVPVSCVDLLVKLKGNRISTALYNGLRTGEAIAVVLDAANWPTDYRDLDLGSTTIPWFWAEDADAYDTLMQLVDSEGPAALVTIDINGSLVFRDRHHRLTRSAGTTVQATFRDTGAEPRHSAPMVYDHGSRDIVNAVSYTVPVRHPAAEFTTVWTDARHHHISDGQTLQIEAQFTEPQYQVDTPVEGVDYQVLTGAVTVTANRNSGQSIVLFATATGGPAIITNLQIRSKPLESRGSVVVSATDSVSTSRYGRRSSPSTRDPVWAGVHDARAIAQLIVGQRAERLPTVTISLIGVDNDVRLLQQLSRDLSDRVHIVEAQTGVDADFFIERIEHNVSESGLKHVTRFGCEKVATQIPGAFQLDSGVLGTNRLGRTGLDDSTTAFRLDSGTQGVLGTHILGY